MLVVVWGRGLGGVLLGEAEDEVAGAMNIQALIKVGRLLQGPVHLPLLSIEQIAIPLTIFRYYPLSLSAALLDG